MSELERELRELGGALDYPPTPDLAPVVRARIARRPRPRRLALRPRALVAAVAVLLLALATAFAVPPARTAILRFFHIQGASVERVPSLPRVPAGARLELGRRVTLDQAERLAGFHVLVPAVGDPDDVYFDTLTPGGMVSLVYGSKRDLRLLLTEFRGTDAPSLIHKLVARGTEVDQVTVNGEPGIWLTGRPHVFLYATPDGRVQEETIRLAGNTLIWQRGGLTLRLEGKGLARTTALAIAQSLR